MDCSSCYMSPLSISLVYERAKLQLELANKVRVRVQETRVSALAHRFQNDGVKKGWKGWGTGPALIFLWGLFFVEGHLHKQCADFANK